jgi:hypothetical protein
MAGNWYFARHKQKLGPFSWGQLRQMAAFGLLERADHVLQEGTTRWREASEVEGLFPGGGGAKEYRLAIGGRSLGPFTASQVRALLLSGRLTSDTMARAGDAAKWVPLAQLSEFASTMPTTSASLAVLVLDRNREMSREEAALYLAGKEGDTLARLIARLMELKRQCEHNATLVQSLERNIQDLTALREHQVPG